MHTSHRPRPAGRRRPIASFAAAAALGLALTGCSGGMLGGGSEPEADPGTAVKADEVVGKGTWPYWSDTGKVTWEINEMRRRGKLLQVTMQVTPGTPKSDAVDSPSLYDLFGTFDIYLVDTKNMRRHTIVTDESGVELAPNRVDTGAPYDKPTTLTYTFAAPEKNVRAMDVYIADFPPILDVPVTS
ncbi:hypothetical protein CLV63_102312 [Murinocardiopsis flavida]|uniref:Lipoprotein n=1 Tax=Murinocardiopsis flavida TaxID=645275 RepID=A0A2P8DSL9_9ACTN|nr:hypothetical protein [Murinocardiopsis flavida]PSL00185.1 hypothetical protein CLV63_102312 [Murinocardiopsis flavida]